MISLILILLKHIDAISYMNKFLNLCLIIFRVLWYFTTSITNCYNNIFIKFIIIIIIIIAYIKRLISKIKMIIIGIAYDTNKMIVMRKLVIYNNNNNYKFYESYARYLIISFITML